MAIHDGTMNWGSVFPAYPSLVYPVSTTQVVVPPWWEMDVGVVEANLGGLSAGPGDLVCGGGLVFLKMMGQVDEGVLLQILAVAEDDQ